MKTGYFAVPADKVKPFRSAVDSTESFEIIRDTRKKVKKTKKSKVPAVPGEEVIPVDIVDDDGTIIGTVEDAYPALSLQGVALASLNNGSLVVHAIIPPWIEKKTTIFLEDGSENTDPLEEKNAKYLGIDDKFIGYTREDVFKKYPELIGYLISIEEFDGEQVEIKTPKLKLHRWSGEK